MIRTDMKCFIPKYGSLLDDLYFILFKLNFLTPLMQCKTSTLTANSVLSTHGICDNFEISVKVYKLDLDMELARISLILLRRMSSLGVLVFILPDVLAGKGEPILCCSWSTAGVTGDISNIPVILPTQTVYIIYVFGDNCK